MTTHEQQQAAERGAVYIYEVLSSRGALAWSSYHGSLTASRREFSAQRNGNYAESILLYRCRLRRDLSPRKLLIAALNNDCFEHRELLNRCVAGRPEKVVALSPKGRAAAAKALQEATS